mmetsp:Transcript_36424/g.72215  ORF Transcript_36424/g.72215 Transcript_36424/m.72215 type:complete len:244 (+) Transcript_36424:517-1248(+)
MGALVTVVRLLLSKMGSSRLVLLSATLGDSTISSILSEFNLEPESVNILRAPIVRPNVILYAQLQRSSIMRDRYESIFRLIKNNHMGTTVVVYVTLRKEAESIAKGLAKNGISAMFYHGGVDTDARELVLDLFHQHLFQVVVATEAFGLGIDAGFATVIIAGGARSVEAVVQLSGRVGRNKKRARAIFFSTQSSISKLIALLSETLTHLTRMDRLSSCFFLLPAVFNALLEFGMSLFVVRLVV